MYSLQCLQVGLLPDVTPTAKTIVTCQLVHLPSPALIRIQFVPATAWTKFATVSFLTIITYWTFSALDVYITQSHFIVLGVHISVT